jgi:hypothetical protein
MMLVITMLIYTVSLEFQSPTSIIIHNQCSDTELISPVYFGNGAVCPKLFDQQVDINTAMKIRFEIYATRDEFEGALLYKLQKSLHAQYSMDTLITRASNNGSKCVYMLVAWKMKDSKPSIQVILVEHTKEFIWNKDKLKELYDKNRSWLKKYDDTVSDPWLACG